MRNSKWDIISYCPLELVEKLHLAIVALAGSMLDLFLSVVLQFHMNQCYPFFGSRMKLCISFIWWKNACI